MSCKMRFDYDAAIDAAKAIAAEEQPRQAANGPYRRALPHAAPFRQRQSSLLEVLPVDCRLLVWEHVLAPSRTRIERWRSDDAFMLMDIGNTDAECFPYRITTTVAKKIDKPLNLLLSCRQLYLEGLSILYSTTFVFKFPLDLYNFQTCACPEGISSVKRLIIASGQIDRRGSGPFFSLGIKQNHPYGSVDEWENAIYGLEKMKSLQELRVLLGHCHVQAPECVQRPWKEHQANQKLEQRHDKLFKLFGTVAIPSFTLNLTWKPKDLISRRQWPFKIELQTKEEMMSMIENELPEQSMPDLYGWQ